MNYNKETIACQCDNWVKRYLGLFSWRKYQKETIVDIIYNILNSDINDNNNNNYTQLNQIVQAPTGSGKSIMLIVSAGVLSEYYNKESYILCSDLSLYQQYVDFININKLNNIIGYIKGQSGNYSCSVIKDENNNQVDIINGLCKQRHIGFKRLVNSVQADSLGFKCANKCQYVKEYKNCIDKKIIITTYHNYLYQISDSKDRSFNKHNILFMDECHNIPNVIQTKFSCTVSTYQIKTYVSIYDFLYNNKDITYKNNNGDIISFKDNVILTEFNKDKLINKLVKKINILSSYTNNKTDREKLYLSLISYYDEIMNIFCIGIDDINGYIDYIYNNSTNNIIDNISNLSGITSLQQLNNIISNFKQNIENPYNDLMDVIVNVGYDYLVKKDIVYKRQEFNNNIFDDIFDINIIEHKGIQLQCVKESYIIDKYLLSTADNNVLVSATVGDKDVFINNISENNVDNDINNKDNIDNTVASSSKFIYNEIPSVFEFNNSPIYVFTQNKLSYKTKNEVLPKMLTNVEKLLNTFNDYRGVIQTGSYEVMNYVYDNIDKKYKNRLFIYNDSKEKSDIINKFKHTDNGILIGPSLYEGIDLPDDLCRFIIIMKTPYPSLGDELVKRKMELYQGWYEAQTSNFIIQGIGRGIRNSKDWCQTFILDGNFVNLYRNTNRQYPYYIKKRIQFF